MLLVEENVHSLVAQWLSCRAVMSCTRVLFLLCAFILIPADGQDATALTAREMLKWLHLDLPHLTVA